MVVLYEPRIKPNWASIHAKHCSDRAADKARRPISDGGVKYTELALSKSNRGASLYRASQAPASELSRFPKAVGRLVNPLLSYYFPLWNVKQ